MQAVLTGRILIVTKYSHIATATGQGHAHYFESYGLFLAARFCHGGVLICISSSWKGQGQDRELKVLKFSPLAFECGYLVRVVV